VAARALEPHLGEAGQDQDRLPGPVAQQWPEHVAAVQAGHQQVKDDQVVDARKRSPQSLGAAARQLDRQSLRRWRPAEARAYRLLVVDDQDTRAGGIAVKYNAHTNDTAQPTAGSTA
jgi:isopentenyldiphosphate isomerase